MINVSHLAFVQYNNMKLIIHWSKVNDSTCSDSILVLATWGQCKAIVHTLIQSAPEAEHHLLFRDSSTDNQQCRHCFTASIEI